MLAATTAIGPLLVYLPFLGAAEATPYRAQGTRGLTGEALPFLPLHLVGVVSRPHSPWEPAGAPGWTNAAATVVTPTPPATPHTSGARTVVALHPFAHPAPGRDAATLVTTVGE